MEENKEVVIETKDSNDEEIVIEEIVEDNVDDDEFLRTLEDIDKDEDEDNDEEEVGEDDQKDEVSDEQRIKNKNAEEARKRREAEAKSKLEKEKQPEAEKEEVVEEKNEESVEVAPQDQVKELLAKYPDINLSELDTDENFQEYLKGKWVKGGPSITTIYENFIAFTSRLTKQDKEEIEKKYQKKTTPKLKGSSGGNGSTTKVEDVYSLEELQKISAKMPYMTPKQYDEVEEKYERSVKYHKKK